MTNPAFQDIRARIDNDFAFHPATPETGPKHSYIRGYLRRVAHELVNQTPAGREQTLMLVALEEAMHWANAAIAKQGPVG